jgi:hypothetical protein
MGQAILLHGQTNFLTASDRVEETDLFFVRTVTWVTAVSHVDFVKRALFGAAKGKTNR